MAFEFNNRAQHITDPLYTAAGKISGRRDVIFRGFRNVSASGTEILNLLNATTTILPADDTVLVVSTSLNDAAAGSGARSVTVYGTDANGSPVSETLATNGTTDVAGTQVFRTVDYVEVTTAGATGSNDGNLSIQNSLSNINYLRVGPTQGRSFMGVFQVPAGKVARIVDLHVANTGAIVNLKKVSSNGVTSILATIGNGGGEIPAKYFEELSALDSIYIEATDVSAASNPVSVFCRVAILDV